jgi:hypothetical protein
LRAIALMACHGAVLLLIAHFTLTERNLDPSALRMLSVFALAAAIGLGNAYLSACDFDKYLTNQKWQPPLEAWSAFALGAIVFGYVALLVLLGETGGALVPRT